MKKVLLSILTFILAVCCVGLIACNNNQAPSTATLVDFTDSTVKIEYGMNYEIEEYVYDTDGVRHTLTAKVTDSNNQTVAQDGAFKALDDEYKVVYTVDFNGSTKTKTVTLNVYSTPVVTVADKTEKTYIVDYDTVQMPEITAFDGEEPIADENVTVKVIYIGKFVTKEVTYVKGQTFSPTEVGTYYWEITAVNAKGISNTAKLYFFSVNPTPVITFDDARDRTVIFGIEKKVDYPGATATDALDGDFTESQLERAVYRVEGATETKMTDYDGGDSYVPTQLGDYVWKVSTTNTRGVTGSGTAKFEVIEAAEDAKVEIIPEEGGESIFTMSKGSIDGFVANEDIPTTYKDLSGNDVAIDNEAGYTGNAYKFSAIPHNVSIMFNADYTQKACIAMAERGDFDFIQFSFLITNFVTKDGSPVTTSSGALKTTIMNNDQGDNDSRSILSSAGYVGSSQRSVAINKWHTYTVPVADFFETLGAGLRGRIIRTFYAVGSSDTCDFYLGEIKTVSLPLPALKDTDLLNYRTLDPSSVLFGYDMLADVTTTTTVTDASGNQIGDVITDTVLDTTINLRNATSSVMAADFPTVNINGTNASTTDDDRAVDITGTCSDPNALKISVTTNSAYYAKLRYTKDQIQAMADAGGYTKIRVTYLIDAAIDTDGNGSGWNARSKGIIYTSQSKNDLNKWVTLEYDIPTFISYMGLKASYNKTETSDPETTTDPVTGNVTTVVKTTYSSFDRIEISNDMVLLNQGFRGSICDFYLAGISFVTA